MSEDPTAPDSPDADAAAKPPKRHRGRGSALADQEDDINDVGIAIEQALVSAASEAAMEGSAEANDRMRRAVEALHAVDALLEEVQGREGPPAVARMAEHAEVVQDAVAVLQRAAATSRGAVPREGEETWSLAERAVRATAAFADALQDLGRASPAADHERGTLDARETTDPPTVHTLDDPVESVDVLGEFAPQWFEIAAASLVDRGSPDAEAVDRLRRALRVLERSRELSGAFKPEPALPEEMTPKEFTQAHLDAMRDIMDSLEGVVAAASEDVTATGDPAAGTRLEAALGTLGALEELLWRSERPTARRARMQPHRRALLEAERVLERATVSAAAAYVAEPDSQRARRYFRMATQASRALGSLTRELQSEWEETGNVDDAAEDAVDPPEDEGSEETTQPPGS